MSKSNKCSNDCSGSDISDLDLDALMKEIENDSDHENGSDNGHNNDTNGNKVKKENKFEDQKRKQEQNKKQKKESNILKKGIKDLEDESDKNQKCMYAKHQEMIKNNDLKNAENPNPKKQKIINKHDIQKEKENNNELSKNKNKEISANQTNMFLKKILKEYLHLPWMKRMDQYVKELKKENVSISFHFDEQTLSVLDNFTTLEEVFQNHFDIKDSEKNKAIRLVLIAQYLFYNWLKKNNLLQSDDTNISEENKKIFLKLINNINIH